MHVCEAKILISALVGIRISRFEVEIHFNLNIFRKALNYFWGFYVR